MNPPPARRAPDPIPTRLQRFARLTLVVVLVASMTQLLNTPPADALLSTLVASDDFESGTVSGGTGWTSDWDFGATDTVIATGTPLGADYALDLGANDTATRTVDLTGYTEATLAFDFACQDTSTGFEVDDDFAVTVNGDLVADVSNTVSCETANTTGYGTFEVYIPAGGAATIVIANTANSNSERTYVDNVRVTATPRVDTDLDGIFDDVDTDDDNDGISDLDECGSPPADLVFAGQPSTHNGVSFTGNQAVVAGDVIIVDNVGSFDGVTLDARITIVATHGNSWYTQSLAGIWYSEDDTFDPYTQYRLEFLDQTGQVFPIEGNVTVTLSDIDSEDDTNITDYAGFSSTPNSLDVGIAMVPAPSLNLPAGAPAFDYYTPYQISGTWTEHIDTNQTGATSIALSYAVVAHYEGFTSDEFVVGHTGDGVFGTRITRIDGVGLPDCKDSDGNGIPDNLDPLIADISGLVLDSNGDPIQGVSIEIFDSNGDSVGTATTAANGSYSFTGLIPDTYTIVETDLTTHFSVSDVDGANDNSIDVVLYGVDVTGRNFVDEAYDPQWTITKSTGSTPTDAGDTLNYSFSLVNDGNVSVSAVSLTDVKCASGPTLITESVTANNVLDVGETQTWTCTSIGVTQDEVDAGEVQNTVTASGTPANGTLADATDTVTTLIPEDPSWTITKTTSSTPTKAGDTLNYSFALHNDGNVTISAVSVTDAKCASGPTLDSESITANNILEVGETQTWTCTSIPVTQGEVDAGEVENTVTASGTAAQGTLANATDTLTTDINPTASIDVTKSSTSTPTDAGDTIDYTFTVENTGDVTISAISVTDAKCATTPTLDSESITANTILEVGETQTWSCTSIAVTQAEVDAGTVDNSVSVSGTPATGTLTPAVDTHQITITSPPSWTLTKTTSSTPTDAGDTLNYSFALHNNGSVSISAVTLTDAKCASGPTLTSESITADTILEVGETQTWTCTSIGVTQSEVDAGEVENTATASGTPARGTLANVSDTLVTEIVEDPSWTLTKTTTSTPTDAGDTLSYSFALFNSGNVTISSVSLTDAKCASGPTIGSESIITNTVLEVGETQTWTCTSIGVTQDEVDAGEVENTATASGTPAQGTLANVSDTLVTEIPEDPSWTITKSTSSAPVNLGDTLDYSFALFNDGNVTISAISVTDAKCASGPTLASESITANNILEVGETQTWTCTSIGIIQAEVDAGEVINSVTATGTPAQGTLANATDTLTTQVTVTASMSVLKSSSSTPTDAGDTIDYTFTVENTGNVNVSAITVTDAKCASGPTLTTESITADTVLEVGETQTWSCTSIGVTQDEVDAGAVDNSVTVSGTPTAGTLDPAVDTHQITITSPPSWTLTKTTSSTPTDAGDTLDYSFALHNNGSVTISSVTLTDAKCASGPTLTTESITADNILEVGETQTWTCTSIPVTQGEVDAGEVKNTATASGTPARGTLANVSDTLVTAIPEDPSWTITKTTSSTPTDAGDTLDYSFALHNNGSVTISSVTLTDAKCASGPTLTAESITANNILEVGETQTWTCTSIGVTQDEVDAGEVENTATASGTPARGTLANVSDTVTTEILEDPSWTLTKSTTSTPTAAGHTLDYTFTLHNDGNVTISAISVTDVKCAAAPTLASESMTSDGLLEVGETQTWTCTSIAVTQGEVDAGEVENTANATGTAARGTLPNLSDTLTTPIDPTVGIDVIKSATSTPARAGDTIDYSFSVINTGQVTISAVTVTDAKCATTPTLDSESITANTLLEVGETQTWSCTSIPVTQAEADAGEVLNTVTADGTPATGTLTPAVDNHQTTITGGPSWTLTKTTSSTPTDAGDTLDYSFALVNDGVVTISAVTVTDAKCATTPTLDSESITADNILEVGETQTWSCTSIGVTQDEVDAGEVENTVAASGTPARGTLPSAPDTLVTLIPENLSWTLTKSTTSTPTAAGHTLDYTFTLHNDGNITISAVSVTDAKCASAPTLDSESTTANGILEVGETQTWSCTSIGVTQGEVDAGEVENTATASGTPARGTLPNLTNTLTTEINPAPAWDLIKATASTPTTAGDTLDYTFTLVNTGNVTVPSVTLTDAKCASGPTLDSESITADNILEVGETQTWTCTSIPVTQDEVNAGEVENTATVSGTPAGGALPTLTRTVTTLITIDPQWTITKATASTPTKAGDTLDYTFTLVNTGNVTVSSVTLTDAKCATSPTLATESITADNILEVGETQTWTCTSIPVTQGEVDAGIVHNEVTATGTPSAGTLEPATDDLDTTINENVGFSLTKATGSTPTEAGDTLDYTFTVENTGNITIDAPSVTDTKCATGPALDTESITSDGVLEVGETQTWSCTSIGVTQGEVDAGSVDNLATLSGTPRRGSLDPVTDTVSVPITPDPAWTLVKATSSIPATVGDTLEYTFSLINDGNVTVSSVTLTDTKCATGPTLDTESITTDSILQVGETWTWSCTSIGVTQDEIDAGEVLNTATATGTPAGGTLDPAIDDLISLTSINPSWVLNKTTTDIPTGAGDTLDYTFSLINDGNVTVSSATLTDAKCATGPTLDTESITTDSILQVGEVWTWSCTSIAVTQDEADAGEVENTATASGTPSSGVLDEAVDVHAAPITPAPAWSLIKATSSAPTEAGDTLDYTFTLTNTGNVTITSVTLTDAKCATGPTLDTESITSDGDLQVGEVWTWSCTSIGVTQDEVDAGEVENTATAAGTPARGTLDPTEHTVTTGITPAPSMQATKAAVTSAADAGDTIDYSFTVVNDGNVTVSSVTLTDDKCATSPTLDSESITSDGDLQVGETQIWTCTSIPVTQDEVDASEALNEATIAGTPTGGTLNPVVVTHTSPITADPSFTVIKASASTISAAGQTADYTFTLVNTGNVTVSPVTVTDDKCAADPTLDTESITADGVLQVGEAQTWSCTSIAVTQDEVDAGSVDNTVTVNGTPARGTLDPITDDHTLTVVPAPSWTLTKATSSTPTAAGDTLDYTFILTNTGNVTITSVTLADDKCAADPTIDDESITTDSILEVGEVWAWSCTSIGVTQDEVDAANVHNEATATGTPAAGTLSPVDAGANTPINPAPAVDVTKASSSIVGSAGDTANYTFTVVNTGNVTVSSLTVTDAKCAADPTLDTESITSDGVLQVGEIQLWSCTSIAITQAEINAGRVDNTVTVSGTPAGGTLDPVVENHTILVTANPTLEVVKTTASAPQTVGETLDYTFTVVNTGNTTINSVTVTDDKCASGPVLDTESGANDGNIEPGEAQVWSCTSIGVTQAEVDAGRVDNTVTASGTPVAGGLTPATDTLRTSVGAAPAWTLVKESTSTPSAAGDTLDYTFTLTNTGNVTVSSVALVDDKCGADPTLDSESITTDSILEVGEVWIWSCTSIPVTQAEVDAGEVVNTATVTGEPLRGALSPAEDTEVVTIDPDPGIELVKAFTTYEDTTGDGLVGAGDTIHYQFAVSNTGNVTLTGVSITDLGATVTGGPVTLAPAETDIGSFTASRVLTVADVDAGYVDNTATTTGRAPDLSTVSDISDSAEPADYGSTDGSGNPVVDGSGDPVDDGDPDNDPVRVPLDGTADLDLLKTAVWEDTNNNTATDAGDHIVYTFTVTNIGTTTVSDITVSDPLVTVVGGPITLAPGQSDDVTFTAHYEITDADLSAGEVTNSAVVDGVDPDGDPVTDTSDDPTDQTDVDPDGDGNPDDPTITSVEPEAPAVGTAKALVAGPVLTDTGTNELSFRVTIENRGDVALRSVQIVEDLAAAFPANPSSGTAGDPADGWSTTTFRVDALTITSGGCSLNPGFDGVTDRGLLVGTDLLGVGQTCVVRIDLTVDPAATTITGVNQVTASGTSPGGREVDDLSTDGTTSDRDGDGSADEDDPTPYILEAEAAPDVDLDNERGSTVTVEPLLNDAPGVTLDPSTIELYDDQSDTWQTVVVIPGEGTWAVEDDGVVVFTPDPNFTGDPTPVGYRVQVLGTTEWVDSDITITYIDPDTPAPVPTLAFTGVNSRLLLALGLVLLLIGLGIELSIRRSRHRLTR